MPAPSELKSAAEARDLLREVSPLGTECVPLEEAGGRVAAANVRAPHDMPPWPRAAMDGYAVRARDVETPCSLANVGTVPMGKVWSGTLGAGQAIAISTGGVVPEGADAVVMVEYTGKAPGKEVAIHRSVAPGANVVRPGDDLVEGDTVVAQGRRLRAQDLAALAAFGVTRVDVYRRPVVSILSTGSEIVPPEETPRPGQVRDMNQVALGAQAHSAGAIVRHGGLVPDDASLLGARLRELAEESDMVILSGGSSVGVRDVTRDALAAIGADVVFHGIRVRPGKPTLFARLGDKLLFGMPGVPVAAMVIFDAFVRPVVWALGGELDRELFPRRVHATMAQALASSVGREDHVRVTLSSEGPLTARPLLAGSAAVSTLLRADGLVVIDSSAEGIKEGQTVEVLLY